MTPTLLLLDYGGTLDRHPDPTAFVRALRARGYVVALHTGSVLSAIHARHPDLIEAVDHIFQKGGHTKLKDMPAAARAPAGPRHRPGHPR